MSLHFPSVSIFTENYIIYLTSKKALSVFQIDTSVIFQSFLNRREMHSEIEVSYIKKSENAYLYMIHASTSMKTIHVCIHFILIRFMNSYIRKLSKLF